MLTEETKETEVQKESVEEVNSQTTETEEEVEEEAVNEAEDTETTEETVDPVKALEAEKEVLEERILRLQAEIANMQRINAKERQDAAKFRSQKLASDLLEVVDNLERALQAETTSEDAAALKKGVEMVMSQLKTTFERENIVVIDPIGQSFDPNFHQAVSVMPATDGQASETVLNVLQKGYLLHERVLRPAMVIVAE
ncbi:nucleotide exchange factor GrpE [Aerococcaceae bacterium zg-BR9]|uniref:nucleotide exchange factor GrpE n=1 Tax=Aerococcaceae bacterium zg-1292 TaxID=2774330 RepID=UPI0040637C95|nr:nucleotide exchange factor GrpE [Aerococcaceae bacterium zg-BR9]MBF6977760.1 nucleotide exchange factor GrpE [Aerococcaceae bacterium zg-BR22]